MPDREHIHHFSALYSHFGPYRDQEQHFHACMGREAGEAPIIGPDGNEAECDAMLVGHGRECDGVFVEHWLDDFKVESDA